VRRAFWEWRLTVWAREALRHESWVFGEYAASDVADARRTLNASMDRKRRHAEAKMVAAAAKLRGVS
jgi:hypothetical protein